MAPLAWGNDDPRTGYFRKSITPLELLGADGANAVGAENTDVVSVANINRQIPGTSYFEQAVKFLDTRPQASKETK